MKEVQPSPSPAASPPQNHEYVLSTSCPQRAYEFFLLSKLPPPFFITVRDVPAHKMNFIQSPPNGQAFKKILSLHFPLPSFPLSTPIKVIITSAKRYHRKKEKKRFIPQD